MEFWWWIVPLLKTGLIGFIIAAFIVIIAVSQEINSDVPLVVAGVLSIPICLGILAVIINFLWSVIVSIWSPYF